MAVEPIIWRTYEQTLPADAVETDDRRDTAPRSTGCMKPTYCTTATGSTPAWSRSRPATACCSRRCFTRPSTPTRGRLHADQPAARQRPRAVLQVLISHRVGSVPRPPVSRRRRGPGRRPRASAASSCTGAPNAGSHRQLHPAGAAGVLRECGSAAPARPAASPDTTSTASWCLGRKSSRSARTDSAVQMCRSSIRRKAVRAVDRHRRNNFRGGPDHDLVVGAVGGRGVEQVTMLGRAPARRGCARPSGTTGIRGAASSNRFSPMPPLRSSTVWRPSSSACTAALHSLSAGIVVATVTSCPPSAPRTSGRRNGGTVLGGWRRGGSCRQQPRGGRGDLGDGGLERVGIGGRRAGDAADLADVLARRGLDLLGGGRGLQTAQFGDIPAHDLHDRRGAGRRPATVMR